MNCSKCHKDVGLRGYGDCWNCGERIALGPSDAAACSPLVWTRTKPTESGYYWYTPHVRSKAIIYGVAAGEHFACAQRWDGEAVDCQEMGGWWAGPIPKPAPSDSDS